MSQYRPAVIRQGMRKIAAAAIAGALALAPTTSVSAQADQSDLAAVEIVRYGGTDRYSTSLLVAEAFAEDAGGSLEWVILVSGRSWHEAVVASSVAGRLGAPVLMTPPHEVRDDTLGFLKRIGASKALLISTDSGDRRAISAAVDQQLQEAGLTVERIGGRNQYETGIAVAERLGAVGELGTVGKTAIVASGEVFADALVAGPLSAHARIPVLLSPKAELHSGVAEYLESADIERVVLMGGTAALSDEVENAIGDLDLAVDRMAGKTRFETATLTAGYAAAKAGRGCFASGKAGLARARVPFDSFSAAPLLARKCAALVLTDPKNVPESTAEYLDGVRRAAGTGTAELLVFGGNAAVSQAAIDAYLAAASDQDEPDTEKTRAVSCGGDFGSHPQALAQAPGAAVFDGRDAAWSPDCEMIAFERGFTAGKRGLWVMRADGTEVRQVLRMPNREINDPAWSPDGSKIAFSVVSWEDPERFIAPRHHIYVANADGSDAVQLTNGKGADRRPTWSPDGTKIAFDRHIEPDENSPPDFYGDSFIVVMNIDDRRQHELNRLGDWDYNAMWSPDGTQIALVVNGRLSVMNADGTNVRQWRHYSNQFSGLSWSPDGSRLAFSKVASTDYETAVTSGIIVALDVESGTFRQVTDGKIVSLNPEWSPDGRYILFNSRESDGWTTRFFVVGIGDS